MKPTVKLFIFFLRSVAFASIISVRLSVPLSVSITLVIHAHWFEISMETHFTPNEYYYRGMFLALNLEVYLFLFIICDRSTHNNDNTHVTVYKTDRTTMQH